MGEVPKEVKQRVWARDQYRCQECGVAVWRPRGCQPEVHHITPQADGGSEDPSNLKTLCFPCHATKASIGHHRRLMEHTAPDLLPNLVKWTLWNLALELIGYAEWLDPMRFPARQVLGDLEKWQEYLDLARYYAEWSAEKGRYVISEELSRDDLPVKLEELDRIVTGIRIGWYAHATQEYLDWMIQEAKSHRGGKPPGP